MCGKYIIILFVVFIFILSYYKSSNIEHFSPVDDLYDNIDIHVINLKSRPIKKKYIQKQFDEQNIKFNFFEAVDGNNLNPESLIKKGIIDPNTSTKYSKRVLRKGEIGCSMSHVSIWMKLLNSNKKYALIFEDDAILCDNFKQKLYNTINEANTTNWDVLYLNENCYNHFGKKCDGESVTENIIRPKNVGYGLYGYIITKEGVKKLFKNVLPFIIPIDNYIIEKHMSEPNIVVLRLKTPIVGINRKFDSDTIAIK
jgi:GR25 family glycosyltransferase involved in LPS biosynthesis